MVSGKRKGSAFERECCKALSLWLTGGKHKDVLWRSAMSGGRATVSKGQVRQCGDICAVAPEGHKFCDKWYVECKHVKKLALDQFIMKGTGPLATYWRRALTEAVKYKRDPMIIARQNGWPVLILTKPNHLKHIINPVAGGGYGYWYGDISWELYRLDDLLKTKCPY